MLTGLQYQILKRVWPGRPDLATEMPVAAGSRVASLFGEDFISRLPGKIVADFGCGEGKEAIELARHGAAKVYALKFARPSMKAPVNSLAMPRSIASASSSSGRPKKPTS